MRIEWNECSDEQQGRASPLGRSEEQRERRGRGESQQVHTTVFRRRDNHRALIALKVLKGALECFRTQWRAVAGYGDDRFAIERKGRQESRFELFAEAVPFLPQNLGARQERPQRTDRRIRRHGHKFRAYVRCSLTPPANELRKQPGSRCGRQSFRLRFPPRSTGEQQDGTTRFAGAVVNVCPLEFQKPHPETPSPTGPVRRELGRQRGLMLDFGDIGPEVTGGS